MALERVNLSEKANNLLKTVKKRYNLKNRSEAFNFIIKEYNENYSIKDSFL